jgi:diaminopimelate decarboxylase
VGGLIIPNLNAQKIYVAADAETNGNGSSWELPFNNLSDALDQAQHGDTIMLKEGNYLSLSKISPFKLKSGVKLIGGFSGNEDELYQSTIFGPTCDSLDKITEDAMLPEMAVGDWCFVENFGAYTRASSTSFNGFRLGQVYYIQQTF